MAQQTRIIITLADAVTAVTAPPPEVATLRRRLFAWTNAKPIAITVEGADGQVTTTKSQPQPGAPLGAGELIILELAPFQVITSALVAADLVTAQVEVF